MMVKRSIIALVSFLFIFSQVLAQSTTKATIDIGQTVRDFTLKDINGKSQSLSSLKGNKGTLIVFISVQCPVSNDYNDRMIKLAEEYGSRGINMIGVNANSSESIDAIKAHAQKNKLSFPILKDVDNKIADMLNASVTPETYLVDSDGKLIYHGRIDNARKLDQVKSNELRNAMDLLLAGKPVTTTRAKAFGCSIKRIKTA